MVHPFLQRLCSEYLSRESQRSKCYYSKSRLDLLSCDSPFNHTTSLSGDGYYGGGVSYIAVNADSAGGGGGSG